MWFKRCITWQNNRNKQVWRCWLCQKLKCNYNQWKNVDTSPTASTNVSTVEDQSSSWGTPFVPSHMKQVQLNDTISTTESDYNVATIISNSSVNSNPVVTKNPEVSAILPKSSVNSNPVVTKNPEVIAIIPNSSVNSHPVVTKNAEVDIDGNKFSFGALSPNTVMSMKDNEAVATIKSCTTVAPESIVNSNPTIVDTTKNSSVRDKTSSLITTISPSHVWCSKPNETASISETRLQCGTRMS